jgi:predicted kinase
MQTLAVFCGMTASGKSTLAAACAKRYGAPYYNTDRMRKELAGLTASTRRPDGVDQGIYTSQWTAATYQAMLDQARQDFAHGVDLVVLDGSYGKRSDRAAVRKLAAEIGVCCLFVFCTCSDQEVQRRLALRARDAEAVSDGRWEIYLHQQQTFERPDETETGDCIPLNTEQRVETMLDWLAAQLQSER